MLDKPENIANSTFLLGFFSFLFLILPGVASLFIFERELFINLDWIKLVLLSASITIPIALLNIVASVTLAGSSDDFSHFSLGIIMGGLSIYVALGISYFIQMTLFSVIGIVLASNVLLWMFIRRKIKSNKKI